MGIEPTTSCLGSKSSTTELRPQPFWKGKDMAQMPNPSKGMQRLVILLIIGILLLSTYHWRAMLF